MASSESVSGVPSFTVTQGGGTSLSHDDAMTKSCVTTRFWETSPRCG